MDNQPFNPAANAAPSVAPGAAPAPNPYLQPTAKQPATPPTNLKTPAQKAKQQRLIMLISLIAVSVLAVTFIGLFIWMYVLWDEASTNVSGQVEEAVAIAVNEKQTELEAAFEEKEKYPYKTFAGPADYGSLTFEYPKTWSVYIPSDATHGGNYEAYFNPDKVSVVSTETINSLRVYILNELTDDVNADYQRMVKRGDMTASVYKINGTNATLYTGAINRYLRGYVAIFKLRDKTVIMQTDAEIFKDDFFKVLDSVRFSA